ncbi:signal peptidase I [Lachnospiraceae bacterium 9_1_43BFAA]|nr:signal peptidase I [Lachnospiraceae bacterium 9_1_43BFAA]
MKDEFYIFGYRPVVVLSGSMEPYMQTNSVAIIQKTKDIEKGDVVMFRVDEDTLVCHRAVKIDEKGNITTKGDNNKVADFDKVKPEGVEGKVVARLNFLSGLIGKFR